MLYSGLDVADVALRSAFDVWSNFEKLRLPFLEDNLGDMVEADN